MELTGKIIEIPQIQTGESSKGAWKKQDVLIETLDEKYPKKVAISLWGELATNEAIKLNEEITVSFDLESNKHNGRYYTEVKAWKIHS